MKFGIDAHTLGTHKGGNETYIKNLILGFNQLSNSHKYKLFVFNNGTREKMAACLNKQFSFQNIAPNSPLFRIPFSFPYYFLKEKIDTALFQYIAPPWSPSPYVLAVHDISFEHFPEYFTKKERLRMQWTTPYSIKKSKHTLTCSEYSRQDIIKTYGINEDRISVVYCGKDERFKPIENKEYLQTILKKYGLIPPFVLFVGNIQPRKNLKRLLQAFTELKNTNDMPHKLVIVGKKAWMFSDVFSSIRESSIQDQIQFTGYVEDKDLPALYNLAEIFIYPSIFEGFGLPILEAMSCGTPVISSNTSSMPEVSGDAALQVDPLSINEIKQSLIKLIEKPDLQNSLSQKGLLQSKKFSWQKAAQETLQFMEEQH